MPGNENVIVVDSACSISPDELKWRFSGAGGPGGQHANTANTRVELTFNIEESRSLTEQQRARLIERYGPLVRIVVADERSQVRNRQIAITRLSDTLARGLAVRRKRRPTSPTFGSIQRRLQQKQARSQRKQERRSPDPDS